MNKVISPCVKNCDFDYSSGLCKGCFRNLDEISKWNYISDTERQEIMRQLIDRKNSLNK